ncbi:MAG: efflux RND transporter periplasmic adaptor subunit [Pseudomonadota bacterium]
MSDDRVIKTKDGESGLIKRGARLILRVGLTIVVVAGAVFAVQFGASELGRRADAAPTPDAADLIPVSASPVIVQDSYRVTRSFIGQVEPQKTVSLSFELPGRIDTIHVNEGDWVAAGQVLADQDLALLDAERDRLTASRTATQAQLRFAEQTVARSEALTERGFTSQAGLDEAMSRKDELLARIAEIDASLRNVAIRIEKSRIIAPFDGRVTERLVDGNETLGAGQRVFGLVELRKPQVRIGVPLDLAEATLRSVAIDVEGREYPGTLITLRPDIDPVTRTRTAIFEIDTDTQPAFGQTARLVVTQTVAARGLWLPVTSLREGVRGQWTILAVDPENTVRAASVEILHAESDRVYVRAALPAGTRLIDAGPQRVTVGQRVTVDDAL